MMDARPQALHGQRRQQRHPEDESINGFLPVSSQETYLVPQNAQGAFTFSAEPSSIIDYATMGLSSSSTNGQESIFTPDTGSSFDSSLHPGLLDQSYPPPNIYMQPQTYTLSPGHSRNGQSISPSQSVDHLSPENGYMSDPNNYSNYTTPNFDGQYLGDQFAHLNFVDHLSPPNGYDQYSNNMAMPLPITTESLATFTAQLQPLPSNARSEAHPQLLSPCPTSNSSPIVTDENTRNMNFSGVSYPGNEYQTSSTPPAPAPAPAPISTPMQITPSKQQHSPALTNSPSHIGLANPQPRTHLTSPIVRIEHYSRGESPSPSDMSRPMSKRSHGSHRKRNHLSPFPDDESSEDEDTPQEQIRVVPVVTSRERGEDGSWLPVGGNSQAGLSPDDREAMRDVWVPSIDDIADHRLKQEKKLEVQDWLTKSEVGSEAGDGPSSTNLLKPFATRRRAKSTNDVHRQGYVGHLSLGVRTNFERFDDSGIPGPGVYVDERSEYDDYDDDDDEDYEPESPPAEIDIVASHADNSYFSAATESNRDSALIRPWVDLPVQPPTSSSRYQPPTSNAAMARFFTRAKDHDADSIAATLGSRRLSESDIGSIRAAPGVIKAIEPDIKRQKGQRRPSFLENILPKRAPNNLLKRKGSIPVQPPAESTRENSEDIPRIEKPKRMGSWGRPKSPRLDTSVANHGHVGPPSSTGLTPTTGPWYQGAKTMIKRTRSRSDLGKSPGLAELMTQHGGPPMPMLASPLAETEATKPSPQPSHGGDDDDDDAQDAVTMDLKVRSDPIIPTAEGFKTHARQLNPRLVDYMVERITQEQTRRYKRLLEFKVKHLNAVKNHNCSSAKFCTDLGGESKQLPPRAGNKDSDAPFIGFQITAPGSSDDDGEPPPEGTVVSAQFPSGVPLPPVKRLPAEFECPLCFKVKKFYKPSDWTKHVHEDVQPFTCTFPSCGEPKSFKRKADWVRHENERHRQLENWTCQIADCNHTCYRKDNFVQHLVREHKIAEPRARTGRGGNKDAPPSSDTDDIWSLVEKCRRDTTKQPKDEPCRFCGNICNSWKKLTVHLAKHMEQISMPILPLVEQKQMNADTIISPVVEMPESRKLSATPNRSPVDNPSRYNPAVQSTFAPGIDPSFGQFPQDLSPSGTSSSAMHTYPPPQMMPSRTQQQQPMSNYAQNVANTARNYPGQTYPQIQEPAKVRGAYMNGLQIPSHPYHNGGIQNGPNRFSMMPVSTTGQQPVFTSSPVETMTYSTDAMRTTYFTHEPQNTSSNNVADMGFDVGNPIHFQQPSAYNEMAYMSNPQHSYPFQNQ